MLLRRFLLCFLAALTWPRVSLAQKAEFEITVARLERQAPRPLTFPDAAYDSKRHRALFFGPDADSEGMPARLLCFDLKSERWTEPKPDGPRPNGAVGPAVAYVPRQDALYLFGGWAKGADGPSDDLWRLDLAEEESLRWKQLESAGPGPRARNGACMAVDDAGNRLLMHGGDGGPHPTYGFIPLDDLWSYDLAENRWTRLEPSGAAPEPRWNHAATIDRERRILYVFGGAGYTAAGLVTDNEVFALDLRSLKWRRLPAKGRPPLPVEGATLTFDAPANVLLVAGGLRLAQSGSAGTTDLWCFDLKRSRWSSLKNKLGEERRDHAGVYDPLGRRHILFGGQTAVERGNYYKHGEPLSDAVSIRIGRKAEGD